MEIDPVIHKICVPENSLIFFTPFVFAPFYKVTLSQLKTLFLWLDSFKVGTAIRHFVAYLSLKFGDIQDERSKGIIDDNMAKNVQNL